MKVKRMWGPIKASVVDCHFCSKRIWWMSKYVQLEEYDMIYLSHLHCYIEHIIFHPEALSKDCYAWDKWGKRWNS